MVSFRSRWAETDRSSVKRALGTGASSMVFPLSGANGVSDGSRQRHCNQAAALVACIDSSTWVGGWLKAATDQNPGTGTARSPLLMLQLLIGPQSVSGQRELAHHGYGPVSPSSPPRKLRPSPLSDVSSEIAKSGAGFLHASTQTRRLRHRAPYIALSAQIHGSSRTTFGQSSCGRALTSQTKSYPSQMIQKRVGMGTSTQPPW